VNLGIVVVVGLLDGDDALGLVCCEADIRKSQDAIACSVASTRQGEGGIFTRCCGGFLKPDVVGVR
jgi:hypothetical protein